MSEQHVTNPLPVGRYWIDVVDKPSGSNGVDDWDAWVLANASKVTTETSTEHEAEGGNPHRLFVIFTVTKPVFFPAANFGFPSFAPASVQTEDDTIQAPPDPPPLNLPSFGDLASALPLPLILLVVALIMSERSGRRAAA